MATELQNLTRIFNNRLFRIPDYQRGYAWTERQWADFWGDLKRASTGRNHYCGQLTVEQANESVWSQWAGDEWLVSAAGYSPLLVVDGQQRITTAVILIQCILEQIPDEQPIAGLNTSKQRQKYLAESSGLLKSCLFGYARDNPSHEFFRTKILGVPSNEFNGIRTVYTENLAGALGYFREKVKELKTIEDKDRYFRALTQRFQFNVHELANDIDVFVAFETMNNRGKSLTRLELLKNRLIYLSTLAPGTDPEKNKVRSNINTVWRSIYEELGRQPGSPLDDDEFLRAHWIIYFGYDKDEADPLTQFLLNYHFTVERIDEKELSLHDIQTYIDSLQNCVRRWQHLHFPELHSAALGGALAQNLTRLKRLGFGVLKPMLLSVLASDTTGVVKCFVTIEAERFLLLVRSLGGARSHVGEAESYRMAHEIFAQRAHVDAAMTMLEDRIERHFTTAIFQTEIDDLYAEGGKGFYSLPALDFILFEYEEELQIQAKAPASKIDWGKFRGSRNSIEHIFPQQAKNEDWPAFFKYPATTHRFLQHSLGNLVAVSVAKNSGLSRSSFKVKVTGNGSSPGFNQGSYSELKIAQYNDWTPAEVLARGLDLLAFIERRWKIKLGDDPTKIRLLKLEFLLPAVVGQ